MNIQQIRNKYRSILQDDIKIEQNKLKTSINNHYKQNEEQQQERDWINIIRQEKQKRVLTETRSMNKQNKQYKDQRDNMNISKTPKKGNTSTQYNQNKLSNIKNSTYNNKSSHSSTKLTTQQQIIQLKQKLAQSILNLNRKDNQLNQFQHLLIKKNQQIKLLNKSINQLKQTIQNKDSLIFQEKVKYDNMLKQINQRDNTIEEVKIQNQLLKQHLANYCKEIQNINHKNKQEAKYYQKIVKEREKIDNYKLKIEHLKDDVKRLQFLLSDHQIYAPLLISLQGKHFLGKPNKQSKQVQYWYPQSLINSIQLFLKKQQIGYGNKIFSQNLIKFIYGLLQKNEKITCNKVKNKYTSRIKTIQRKKNHIVNLFQTEGGEAQGKKKTHNNSRINNSRLNSSMLNASSLRKTTPLNGNSQLKSRDFSICLQKSLCLQKQALSSAKYSTKFGTNRDKYTNTDSKIDQNKKPFIIQGLQKSVRTNQYHKKHVILQLIQSFSKGVQKLFKLQNKTLAQQKIVQLCQWLRQSVQEIYQTYKYPSNDNYTKQTGKWKTVADC